VEAPPFDRLSFHAQPEAAAAGADFVQENGPERESAKRELFCRLDAASEAVAIALSSSGLPISRLQVDCRHPERCIFHLADGTGGVTHFFGPFAGPMQEWWRDLGQPQLTETVRQKLAEGIAAGAAGPQSTNSPPSATGSWSRSSP